jgi:hypothetical protein
LPQSPVEGGSWIAAAVSNGIATTAGAVREELLRLAKQMLNSPLAGAMPDHVALADGKLVSKRDASRTVPIADAMRHGDDGSHAHNTHSAIFRRSQSGRAARRDSRQRGGGRPHPQTPRQRAARSSAASCEGSA